MRKRIRKSFWIKHDDKKIYDNSIWKLKDPNNFMAGLEELIELRFLGTEEIKELGLVEIYTVNKEMENTLIHYPHSYYFAKIVGDGEEIAYQYIVE